MLTKDGRELSPSARLKSHLKKWKTDVGSDGSHRGFFAVTDLLRKNVGVCVLSASITFQHSYKSSCEKLSSGISSSNLCSLKKPTCSFSDAHLRLHTGVTVLTSQQK